MHAKKSLFSNLANVIIMLIKFEAIGDDTQLFLGCEIIFNIRNKIIYLK